MPLSMIAIRWPSPISPRDCQVRSTPVNLAEAALLSLIVRETCTRFTPGTAASASRSATRTRTRTALSTVAIWPIGVAPAVRRRGSTACCLARTRRTAALRSPSAAWRGRLASEFDHGVDHLVRVALRREVDHGAELGAVDPLEALARFAWVGVAGESGQRGECDDDGQDEGWGLHGE